MIWAWGFAIYLLIGVSMVSKTAYEIDMRIKELDRRQRIIAYLKQGADQDGDRMVILQKNHWRNKDERSNAKSIDELYESIQLMRDLLGDNKLFIVIIWFIVAWFFIWLYDVLIDLTKRTQ